LQTFKSFEEILYTVNEGSFENIALRLFRLQASKNQIYRQFINHLGVEPAAVSRLDDIPFLPISFFKTHAVQSDVWAPEVVFTSSGTTGATTSSHAVKSNAFYLSNSERIFTEFFGPVSNYHVLALLPSYLERTGSSLIAMADYFIKESKSPHSGFYLNNYDALAAKIRELQTDSKKIFLIGVSFALLDLADRFDLDMSNAIVMETGGMKGRRAELTREELHTYLMQRFHVGKIHSEYGMTELLSQGYSTGDGIFKTPTWMKILIRDMNDPFAGKENGQTGGINVIDLANIYSCAFIETQDLGKVYQDGNFEVLGRIDNSDARGCNLLVE
jgi:phenylacetate-coenzyme A ligase PaaK-like adenylate-forming protein